MSHHSFVFVRLTRANQVYSFPIHLCEEMMPSPVFYGTLAPIFVYVVVKNLIVDPYIKVREAEKVKKQKEACVGDVMKRRKEALAAVELMEAAYLRVVAEEQAKNGLIIVKAYYGNVSTGKQFNVFNKFTNILLYYCGNVKF